MKNQPSKTEGPAAAASSNEVRTYIKIAIRTIVYAAGFVGVIVVGSFCADAVFDAVNKLSKWIMPVILGAFALFVCFVVACAKEYGWDKEDDEHGQESDITSKDGLLWRDGKVIGLPEADIVAKKRGYLCAEQMVHALASIAPTESSPCPAHPRSPASARPEQTSPWSAP